MNLEFGLRFVGPFPVDFFGSTTCIAKRVAAFVKETPYALGYSVLLYKKNSGGVAVWP